MSITLKNITFIIVSFKSDYIIEDCIKSIDSNVEILVVENSNNIQFKKKLEDKYSNVKCILSKHNLGMGAGNNLGIKNVKNDFAFIINPDVVLETNTIKELINCSNILDNFAILAPISNNKDYPNFELFGDEPENSIKPFRVKSVDGYAMLLNLKKLRLLQNFNYFDENIFLYLENDDLCKQLNNRGEDIYIVPKSKISHLGAKAVNPLYEKEVELSRNWHWMWSKFYFNKKYYGFLRAFLTTYQDLLSSSVKVIYHLITFNSHKRKIYQMRLLGLMSSMIGIKSYYRPKVDI
jgi:N-acetylglucosaminyl-diphospho-decaprenol L-rhamnosyltransferase